MPIPELVPCLLERKPIPKPWGGRALESMLGIDLPGQQQIGESWELYDRAEGSSAIRDRDWCLHDLVEHHAKALLGHGVKLARGGRFPLLLKLIDAAEALSVQVHPDDDQAALADDDGKSEAWLILHAGPRGRVLRGFREPITPARFAAVAPTAGVVEVLQAFAPRPGDAVWVPPGTVHALGPDLVLFEIQRNSDITYRLYDWGRDRELHLEQGLRATRYDQPPQTTVPSQPAAEGGEWLIRDPHFRLRRWTLTDRVKLLTQGTFKVLTVLQGQATVGWHSQGRDDPLVAKRADTVLVPACYHEVFVSPIGSTTLLISDPGRVP